MGCVLVINFVLFVHFLNHLVSRDDVLHDYLLSALADIPLPLFAQSKIETPLSLQLKVFVL